MNDFKPRRSHKKSRQGCDSCKARKVKCDEERPICKVCLSRRMECVYSTLALRLAVEQQTETAESYSDLESEEYNTRSTSSADATAHSTTTSRIDSSGADDARIFGPRNSFWHCLNGLPQERQQRVSDPELLNHYFSHTSKTIAAASNDRGKREAWEVVIPRLAFRYEGVAHALRAVSMLHLVSELLDSGRCCVEGYTGDSHEVLRSEAESQYGRALQLLQADIANFEPTMGDSILATSSLLFVFNTAYEGCVGAEASDLYTCQVVSSEVVHMALHSALPKWFRFTMGIKTVLTLMAPEKRSTSELEELLGSDGVEVIPDDVAHMEDTDPVFLERVGALHRPSAYSHRMFETLGITRLAAFATLNAFLQGCGRSAHTTSCCTVLQFLETVTGQIFNSNISSRSGEGPRHSMLYDKNPLRTIFGLPARLDVRFIQLLEANDIRALMVYAHFLAFLIIVDDVWFARRIGGKEIDRISDAMEAWEKKEIQDPGTETKFDWRPAMRWPLEMVKQSRQARS